MFFLAMQVSEEFEEKNYRFYGKMFFVVSVKENHFKSDICLFLFFGING